MKTAYEETVVPIKFSSKRRLTNAEEAAIQKMIASDPENPEATDEQLAQGRPFRNAFPDLAKSIDREKARRGRPKIDKPRKQISIRLDAEVIEHYKNDYGKGWQSRINNDLRKAAGIQK